MAIHNDKDGKKVRLKKDGTPDRRKPPKQSQFQKGQSGNPSGRPKGTKKTGRSALEAALSRERVVREGNEEKILSLDELGYLRIANMAANGDIPAFRALLMAKSLSASYAEPKTAEEVATERQLRTDIELMMSTFFVLAGLRCFQERDGNMMIADWVAKGLERPSNPKDVTYSVPLWSLQKKSNF